MDYLHIDSFTTGATHGHYEHEWSREQNFDVSLKVGFESKKSGDTDTLADTIDYDDLKKILVDTLAGKRRFLVEKIAEEIAAKVLKDARALEVTVTIRKLEAWDNGVPGVTITRTR
jgi:dihydroneopterin aldolase/2-amino-4-hydroxy-6-hydroxymethyldihydropteridine diphosphokinase